MTLIQDNFKGDALQKLASAGFISGGVLLLVFNLLSPRPADPSNFQSVLTTMADQKFLTLLSQLFLVLGIWGVMMGSAGVYHTISGAGSAWARFGFYGIVVGTALWSITFGLGSVTGNAAESWMLASTADKPVAYNIATAVSAATSGIETMSILMLWWAIIFLGIGIARSGIYPSWFGWVGAVLGIVMVAAVGVPKFFAGNSSTLLLLFGGLALITTLWFLVFGIWVARKAW